MHRAEVITVERRRRWSWADKQQIVDETLMPGASISAVARRYGLHPSQVFAWRKTVREGDIADATGCGSFDCAFAPVVVTKPRLPPSDAGGAQLIRDHLFWREPLLSHQLAHQLAHEL